MQVSRSLPIRVAYFVPPSPVFAGIERVVHEIASGLSRKYPGEFEVHVIYCNRFQEVVDELPSYRLHVLDVDRLRNVLAPLRVLAARERFNVFICAQVEASVLAWFATRFLRRMAFVAHLHGNPKIEYREGSRRTRLAYVLFSKFLARRLAAVFCVSPSLAQYVRRLVGPQAVVKFAPNPIRAVDPALPDVILPKHVSKFVNVGRIQRQKGQDVLVQGFASALRVNPNLSLTIVGDGEDRASLETLVAALGVSDSVTFAGQVRDPATLMAASDCFVLSSRWEGLPGVLLEALRLGMPIVATDCDFGPSDVLLDSELGQLVPVDDPWRLAEAILAAAESTPTSDAVLRRKAAASRFDAAQVVGEHRDLLVGLAG